MEKIEILKKNNSDKVIKILEKRLSKEFTEKISKENGKKILISEDGRNAIYSELFQKI